MNQLSYMSIMPSKKHVSTIFNGIDDNPSFSIVHSLLIHTDIKPGLLGGIDSLDFDPKIFKNHVFYVFYSNEEPIGISIFDVHNEKCHYVDIGFIKSVRGKLSYKMAQDLLSYHLDRFNNPVLVTAICKDNKPSLYFALYLKFKIILKTENYYYARYSKWGM